MRSNRRLGFPWLLAGLATLALSSCMKASGDPPAVGAPAPDFSLATNEGTASLKDYRGKWVVLYFYPKDKTPGCTIEARNFQRDIAGYEQRNAVVLGVNLDSADSHKDFCAKEGLSFKLLADAGGRVTADYGSLMRYLGVKIPARNTFLIDPEGKIARVFLEVSPREHSAEVLVALDELQKG